MRITRVFVNGNEHQQCSAPTSDTRQNSPEFLNLNAYSRLHHNKL